MGKTLVTAVMMAGLSWSSAHACMTVRSMDYSIFAKSEVLMRAELITYEKRNRHAMLRLKKIQHFLARGRGVMEWSARWYHPTYSVPDRWNGSRSVIIGLRAVIDPNGSPVIEVVQQPCGPISILEDTPDNLKKVMDALKQTPMSYD